MPRRLASPPALTIDPASGELTVTRPPGGDGLDAELSAVLARWAADGLHAEQTLTRMGETVTRFTARLRSQGVASFAAVSPAQAGGFITARTRDGREAKVATQHARRTAVRALYRTLRALGAHAGDPTLDVALPPRGSRVARPLTTDEVVLARISAQVGPAARSGMRAVAWALGEATAVSSEITVVRVIDLDLPTIPRTVALPGTRRHEPRTASLTPWGAAVIARHTTALAAAIPPAEFYWTRLAYTGAAAPGGATAQASACNALRAVLDAAGLGGEPDVRPSSLRHWAARTAYDAGTRIDGVARMLGHRSLDAAAEDIGLDWREVTR